MDTMNTIFLMLVGNILGSLLYIRNLNTGLTPAQTLIKTILMLLGLGVFLFVMIFLINLVYQY